ncbi:MAG: hypothetical protein WBV70_03950 [Candidatus Bathyarchaeia archaeon]
MKKTVYSGAQLRRIWENIGPKKVGEEHLRIDALESEVGRLGSYLDIVIRQIDLIGSRLDKLEGFLENETEALELVKIPEKEATKKVSEYISQHPGCRTSDIIYDLHLDPDLVLKVLRKLRKQEKVRGKNVGK